MEVEVQQAHTLPTEEERLQSQLAAQLNLPGLDTSAAAAPEKPIAQVHA